MQRYKKTSVIIGIWSFFLVLDGKLIFFGYSIPLTAKKSLKILPIANK